MRAEKAARRLAKQLHTTISEAVAVACERLLDENDQAAGARRRRAQRGWPIIAATDWTVFRGDRNRYQAMAGAVTIIVAPIACAGTAFVPMGRFGWTRAEFDRAWSALATPD